MLNENQLLAEAWHERALQHIQENNMDEATHCLEKARAANPYSPLIQLHLANAYKVKKEYILSEKILLALCEAHPEFAGAYNNLGTIYYLTERFEDAAYYYQIAINIQPDYVDAYYNIALALTKLKHFSQALLAHQTVIELSPTHGGSLFQLGCLYMQQGNEILAVQQFKKLHALYPYHFETQANLAACYLRHGLLQKAEEHYQHALAILPQEVDVLFNLGVIAMQNNDMQKAIIFYQQVITINSDYYAAHNNLSVAYLAMNERELALHHFQEVLRLLPQDEAIKHTIAILQQNKTVTTSPPAYIKALFDSYANHYESHLTKTLDYRVPHLIYRAYLQHKKHANAILDLGCGTGLCAAPFIADPLFKESVWIGVDLSEKMLNVAAEKKYYQHLHQIDIVAYVKQETQQYDGIIAGDVLVYQGELEILFHAIAARLLPQGLFIFTTEISTNERYYLNQSGRFAHSRAYINELAAQCHLTILTSDHITLRMHYHEAVSGCLYVLQMLTIQ